MHEKWQMATDFDEHFFGKWSQFRLTVVGGWYTIALSKTTIALISPKFHKLLLDENMAARRKFELLNQLFDVKHIAFFMNTSPPLSEKLNASDSEYLAPLRCEALGELELSHPPISCDPLYGKKQRITPID